MYRVGQVWMRIQMGRDGRGHVRTNCGQTGSRWTVLDRFGCGYNWPGMDADMLGHTADRLGREGQSQTGLDVDVDAIGWIWTQWTIVDDYGRASTPYGHLWTRLDVLRTSQIPSGNSHLVNSD